MTVYINKKYFNNLVTRNKRIPIDKYLKSCLYLSDTMKRVFKKTLINNGEYEENKIYLQIKIKYLFDNYSNKRTISTYWGLFKKYILQVEKDFKKDLYKFNEEEVRQMMLSIPTTSMRIKNSIGKLASLYIDWALKIERLAVGTNPFEQLDFQKLIVVNKKGVKSEYYSMDSMIEMAIVAEEKEIPYQKIIVALLGRLGIYGDEGINLADLRKNNINRETNTISIVNNETGELLTQIPITDERIYYWLDMAESETFYKYKPYITENNIERKGNEVVFFERDGRVLKSYNNEFERVLKGNLYNALKIFFKTNKIKLLGFKKLMRCAKFDQLDKRLKDNGKLTVTDVQEVQRMYEPTSTYSSYYTLKQDYESYNPNIKIEK